MALVKVKQKRVVAARVAVEKKAVTIENTRIAAARAAVEKKAVTMEEMRAAGMGAQASRGEAVVAAMAQVTKAVLRAVAAAHQTRVFYAGISTDRPADTPTHPHILMKHVD